MKRPLAVLLLLVAACAPERPRTASVKPGWQWSTDSVFRVTNAVRAGRSLQPQRWPNNARVAVLLSFDADNETVSLRFGEPTIGALSQGEYGARVALGRVVDLLDRHRLPASFFIPAVSLMLRPAMADLIKRSGRHEFGVHGWIHETNTQLPAEVERDLDPFKRIVAGLGLRFRQRSRRPVFSSIAWMARRREAFSG